MAAAPAGGSLEATAPTRPEVLLERGAGDVGDRHPSPLSLVAKPSVEVVGELYGSATHGDASIPFDSLLVATDSWPSRPGRGFQRLSP